MNRKHVTAMLPILVAFSEGKAIQYNSGSVRFPNWIDLTDSCPSWDSPPEFYRLKPEPRKVFALEAQRVSNNEWERILMSDNKPRMDSLVDAYKKHPMWQDARVTTYVEEL